MIDEQSRRVIAYYQKAATDYDKEYEVPFFKEIYDNMTWHYIEPYLPNAGVVLDAGGGTGKWAIPIARKGLKVVLFDISQDMLSVASSKIKKQGLEKTISLRRGDICSISLADNTFDFVLAEGDAISYCSNPDSAIKELGRVLKPNRYLSCGVDSLYAILRRILNQPEVDFDLFHEVFKRKRFYAKDWDFHYWLFTPKDLKQLFAKHGFRIVKIAGKPIMFMTRPETSIILEDKTRVKRLLEAELRFCEEPSIVGYGGHLHIVAQKKA